MLYSKSQYGPKSTQILNHCRSVTSNLVIPGKTILVVCCKSLVNPYYTKDSLKNKYCKFRILAIALLLLIKAEEI